VEVVVDIQKIQEKIFKYFHVPKHVSQMQVEADETRVSRHVTTAMVNSDTSYKHTRHAVDHALSTCTNSWLSTCHIKHVSHQLISDTCIHMSVPHTTMSEPWIIKLVQIPERQSRFRSILFDNIAKFSNIKLRYKISTIWTKKECFDWDRREQHWAQDFQTSVISFLVQITTILTAIITMRTKLPERILNSNNYSNEQFYT